jgi:hypothetical protein
LISIEINLLNNLQIVLQKMDELEQHIDLNSILVGVDGSSASWMAYEVSNIYLKLQSKRKSFLRTLQHSIN